jgi:hypothetical protein
MNCICLKHAAITMSSAENSVCTHDNLENLEHQSFSEPRDCPIVVEILCLATPYRVGAPINSGSIRSVVRFVPP